MNGSQQMTENKKNILNKLRQIKRFRPETALQIIHEVLCVVDVNYLDNES